nr:2730_t:CDS:2 [Entrophospora candida]
MRGIKKTKFSTQIDREQKIEEIEAESTQGNQTKEWVGEHKAEIYKKDESGKHHAHPKYDMIWFTKTKYNTLRELYRAREYEKERKSGLYTDAEIWKHINMQKTWD